MMNIILLLIVQIRIRLLYFFDHKPEQADNRYASHDALLDIQDLPQECKEYFSSCLR